MHRGRSNRREFSNFRGRNSNRSAPTSSYSREARAREREAEEEKKEREALLRQYSGHQGGLQHRRNPKSFSERFSPSWDPREDTMQGASSWMRNADKTKHPSSRPSSGSSSSMSRYSSTDRSIDEARREEMRAEKREQLKLAKQRKKRLLASRNGQQNEDEDEEAGKDITTKGENDNVDETFALNQPTKKARRTTVEALQSLDDQKHWSEKSLLEMTDRDWRIFKEDFGISLRGGRVPNPLRSWDELDMDLDIRSALDKLKYKEPTPIQRQCIPIGLAKRDTIGLASTGSGKTLAFLLPMLQFLVGQPRLNEETCVNGPYALILAPTRELALQIQEECLKFTVGVALRSVVVVGGQSIEEQSVKLRRGAEIVIGTPGRVNDCLGHRYLVLGQCTYVVLDEADRMIDMGFLPQVEEILDRMPLTSMKPDLEDEEMEEFLKANSGNVYRQTFMFSATMAPSVEKLAKKYLRVPSIVQIGDLGVTVDSVDQEVIYCENEQAKKSHLMKCLNRVRGKGPVMVFTNQKSAAESLSSFIEEKGNSNLVPGRNATRFRTSVMHGGKSQDSREHALNSFRRGNVNVLVCTGVGGRGLDIKGVVEVVNFDMPSSIEDYIHRIGRTGRAGLRGHATSFLTSDDTEIMFDLRKLLEKSKQVVPRELERNPASSLAPSVIRANMALLESKKESKKEAKAKQK